jgi:hypothetical protein
VKEDGALSVKVAVILAVAAVLVAAIIGGVLYINAERARDVVTCKTEPARSVFDPDMTERVVCRDSQGNEVVRP